MSTSIHIIEFKCLYSKWFQSMFWTSEFDISPITSQSSAYPLRFEKLFTSFLLVPRLFSGWILWYNKLDNGQEWSKISLWLWHKISCLHLTQETRVGLFLCMVAPMCCIIQDFLSFALYDGTVFEHTRHWNSSASEPWLSFKGVKVRVFWTYQR